MDVLERLPALPDDGLGDLRASAERLERTGSPVRRASAARLLPAIGAELAGRRAARLEAAAQARRRISGLRPGRGEARAGGDPVSRQAP